jgi:hypothetical protein
MTEITTHKLVQRVGREVALFNRRPFGLVRGMLRVESKGSNLLFSIRRGPNKKDARIKVGEQVAIKELHAVGKPGGGLRWKRQYREYDYVGQV